MPMNTTGSLESRNFSPVEEEVQPLEQSQEGFSPVEEQVEPIETQQPQPSQEQPSDDDLIFQAQGKPSSATQADKHATAEVDTQFPGQAERPTAAQEESKAKLKPFGDVAERVSQGEQPDADITFRGEEKPSPVEEEPQQATAKGIPEVKPTEKSDYAKLGVQKMASNSLAGAKTFVEGLDDFAVQTVGRIASAYRGGDIDTEEGIIDKTIEWANNYSKEHIEEQKQEYGAETQIFPGITVEDMAKLPKNMAYTAVSGLGGLAVGAPTAMAPIPGARPAGWAAGTAASGGLAYRMAKDEFVSNVKDLLDKQAKERRGEPLKEKEWEKIKQNFDEEATKYGLWEAVPEAIGQAATLGIIRLPGGSVSRFLKLPNVKSKVLKGLASAGSKYSSIWAEEMATETITEKGQAPISKKVGLREEIPTWGEAAREVAPQVTLLTAVMSGAGGIGSKTFDRVSEATGQGKPAKDLTLESSEQVDAVLQNEELFEDWRKKFEDVVGEEVDRDTFKAALKKQKKTLRQREHPGVVKEEPTPGFEEPVEEEVVPTQEPGQTTVRPTPETGAEPFGQINLFDEQFQQTIEGTPIEEPVTEPVEPLETEQPKVNFKKDGTPYTEKGVKIAVQNMQKKGTPAEAVEVEPGKWGWRRKSTEERVEEAAEETNTSPSEEQIKAGNYQKGTVPIQGMEVSIENPRGSIRSGTDPDGNEWSVTMQHHYGYVRGSEGRDGEQVDVFVGPDPDSEQVYVIDQVDPQTQEFDEHKAVLGANSAEEARQIYLSNYEEGWDGIGGVASMPVDQFKEWLKEGKKQTPISEMEEVKDARRVRKDEGQVLPGEEGVLEAEEPSVAIDQEGEGPALQQRSEQGGEDLQQQQPEQPGDRGGLTEEDILNAYPNPEGGESRSPWMMPLDAWLAYESHVFGGSPPAVTQRAKEWHKGQIRDALAEGKPVPQKVLNEYPDLKQKQEAQYAETGRTEDRGREDREEAPGATIPDEKRQAISRIIDKAEEPSRDFFQILGEIEQEYQEAGFTEDERKAVNQALEDQLDVVDEQGTIDRQRFFADVEANMPEQKEGQEASDAEKKTQQQIIQDQELELYEKGIGRIREMGGIQAADVQEQHGKEGVQELRRRFGPAIVRSEGEPMDVIAQNLAEESPELGIESGDKESLWSYLTDQAKSKREIKGEAPKPKRKKKSAEERFRAKEKEGAEQEPEQKQKEPSKPTLEANTSGWLPSSLKTIEKKLFQDIESNLEQVEEDSLSPERKVFPKAQNSVERTLRQESLKQQQAPGHVGESPKITNPVKVNDAPKKGQQSISVDRGEYSLVYRPGSGKVHINPKDNFKEALKSYRKATEEPTPGPEAATTPTGLWGGNLEQSIQKLPNGKFRFAGDVDARLALEDAKTGGVPTEEQIKTYTQAQSRAIGKKQADVKTKTFESKQEAIEFARSLQEGGPVYSRKGKSQFQQAVEEHLPPAYQRADHGNPYRGIEQTGFDISRIGSGEGAQAFGWGLYFAGKREIGEFYREQLTSAKTTFALKKGITPPAEINKGRGETVSRAALKHAIFADLIENKKLSEKYWENLYGDISEDMLAEMNQESVLKHIEMALAIINDTGLEGLESSMQIQKDQGKDHLVEILEETKNYLNKHVDIYREQGQLYEVEVPDESELLDWDALLSKQHPEVRKAMDKSSVKPRLEDTPRNEIANGKDWYKGIATRLGSEQEASKLLNSLGIKGHKYKDASARGTEAESYNYVIYDDQAIEILNTYYSFAGRTAETADQHSLIRAQRMLAQGEDTETVRQETGWFKGPDDKWRFEINDKDATIHVEGFTKEGQQYRATLEDILSHPKLYAAYPWLKLTTVGTTARPESVAHPKIGHIDLSQLRRDELADYLGGKYRKFLENQLKKLQEQDVEKLARQSWKNYPEIYRSLDEAIKEQQRFRDEGIEQVKEELAKEDPGAVKAGAEERIASTLLHEIQHHIQAFEGFGRGGASQEQGYRFLSGEAEARNVQTRMRQSEAGQRIVPPEATLDVNPEDIIVEFDGQEAHAAPLPANALIEQPAGMSATNLRQSVDAVAKRWANAPRINVVQSETELPAAIQRDMESKGAWGDVEGVFWGGEAYLVADNLPSVERAQWVLLHEAIGHNGLRGVMGQEARPILKQAYLNKDVRDRAQALSQDYGFDLRTESGRLQATEEALANMAAEGVDSTALDRVVAKVREWIRKVFPKLKMSDAEVRSLIGRSRAFVEGPGQAAIPEVGQLAYSRRKKPDIIPEELMQAYREVQQQSRKGKTYNPEHPERNEYLNEEQQDQQWDKMFSGLDKNMESSRVQNAKGNLDSAINKIGKPKKSVSEQLKGFTDRWFTRWNQGMFDRFSSLKSLDVEAGITNPQEQAYIAARFTTSLADQLSAIVHYGAPYWESGAMAVNTDTGGFLDILKNVKGEERDFFYWLIGLRADKLNQEGRENLFNEQEIEALKGLAEGRKERFIKARKRYIDFKTSVLDFAEEAGLINSENRSLWEHDEYIPFYRVSEETETTRGPATKQSLAGQTSKIRTLRGGTENIGDPLANIIQNFIHLIDASVKNHAMDLAVENAEKIGAATKASYDWEALKLKNESLARALDKVVGSDESGKLTERLTPEQKKSLQTVFRMVKPSDKDIVSVTRNGKPEFYHVHDPLLLRALTNVNAQSWNNPAMRFARGMKRLLTVGVTSSPEFMIRNLARDTIHAWTVTDKGFRPVVGSIMGASKTLRNDEDTIQMLAAGAAFHGGYAIGHDPDAAAREIKRLYKKHGIDEGTILDTPKKLGGFVKWGWDRWQDLGSAIENSTRTRIYDKMKKQGYTHLEAAFEAKDIMDYSMRGDWPMIQFLCEVVPFLGARLQGLQRLGRGAKANPWAFATKGFMLSMAAAALAIANYNNDDYKALEEWDKDNYFHFFVGDKHYRLPKPFEVGALFGTIPERIVQQVMQEPDGKLALDRMWFMIRQTFAMDFPQVVKPWFEQWANRNTFTGRPIVGLGLRRLDPEAQSYPWTSETAQQLGKMTDISPKRIEHFTRSVFGTLGMYALSASDVITRHAADYPVPPARSLDELPVLRSFYRSGPARHTKYVNEVYDMMSEMDKLTSTVREYMRRRDFESAKGMFKDIKEEWGIESESQFKKVFLAKDELTDKVRPFFRKINKAMRAIHRSNDLTPEQKKEKLDELLRRKNEIARKAVEAYKRTEKATE